MKRIAVSLALLVSLLVVGHDQAHGTQAFGGRVTFLRLNDFNDVYGPPGDSINAEVFFSLAGAPGRVFGLTLRNDVNGQSHLAAVRLLSSSWKFGGWICVDVDTSLPGNNKLVWLGRVWWKASGAC
ncbi:MAG: hypothetical protein IT370_27400 [Deltaproteobacteria bacterium]|nr:hypothetical protein [Deltaproteobacteria bacterium]